MTLQYFWLTVIMWYLKFKGDTMTRFTTILMTGVTALAFTACGGGSSGSGGNSSTPPPPTSISGGDASAPAILSFDLKNEISTNTAYNYFQYTGVEDTKLIMHATLDEELTSRDKINAQYSSNKLY